MIMYKTAISIAITNVIRDKNFADPLGIKYLVRQFFLRGRFVHFRRKRRTRQHGKTAWKCTPRKGLAIPFLLYFRFDICVQLQKQVMATFSKITE